MGEVLYMKINQVRLSVIIFVVIFGTIIATSAAGLWRTTNSKTPARYRGQNDKGTSAISDNPQFIKGKTTFREVLALGVKQTDIEEIIKIKIPDASFNIKDFCMENGLEFSYIKAEVQKLIDEK